MSDNTPEPSVTQWVEGLKRGEEEAAAQLWRRYFERLVRLAQAKLGPSHRRVADEEDVALSAFRCLCEGAGRGKFPELTNRDDLWRLLATLALRKAIDQKRRDSAQHRGGGEVRGESVFEERGLDQVLADGPTPESAAILAEEHGRLLALLDDEALRQVALKKLEGHTNEEIAEQLGVTCRSVERKLQRIRTRWLEGRQE